MTTLKFLSKDKQEVGKVSRSVSFTEVFEMLEVCVL